MKNFLRIIFGCLIISECGVFDLTAQDSSSTKNSLGVVVGAPQTVALVYDRLVDDNISLQVHVGSVIIFSSVGIRINWISSRHRFFPYLFSGTVLIHSEALDAGDPAGTTGYLWLGTGVRYARRHWILFGEFSGFFGGDKNKGVGDNWIFPFNPALGGGMQFRF